MQDFINRYTGKITGNTPENTGECVGLVMVYLASLGLSHIWGHAKDLINNAPKSHYTVILKTPTGVPQKGDVICWNANTGGGLGHTALVVEANVNTITVFEQNTNPKAPHITKYWNYNNVIGWIRPIKQGGGGMATMYRGYDVANPASMKAIVDGYFNRGAEIEQLKKDVEKAKQSGNNETANRLKDALKEFLK